jgi:LysM repeat protein
LALILLPSIARAQTPQVHRVVSGNTLWGLAQNYYNDPYRWPRIYEANRGVVEDPHWIYPGEELVIPDVNATEPVVQVTVQPAPAAPAPAPAPAGEPDRTVFYQGAGARGFGVMETMEQNRLAVARSVSFAAPWLSPIDVVPAHIGTVIEFAGAEDEHVPRFTPLPYDRLEIAFTGPAPARGTELLAFRVDHELEGIGNVLVPTGVLAVSDPAAGAAVALVVDVFDRMSLGDMLIALPAFALRPGVRAQPATNGAEATLIAFASEHAIQELNDVAFLDQGSDQGVRIGDEYIAVWNEGSGTPPEVEGRMQVIAVHPDHSSARIVWMKNPIFQTGVRVRVDQRMP